MTTEHPITPPPELMQKWISRAYAVSERGAEILAEVATQAARWGSDQELEACITWVAIESLEAAKELRSARRPKPPSLKEKGLAGLAKLEAQGLCPDLVSEIRRALEQLDD